MTPEGLGPLLFNLALLIFSFLLLLNNAQEFVTLSLGLLGQHDLTLDKLLSARQVQFFGLLLCKLSLLAFFSTSSALSFFECTLGSECINLTLTIGSSLLEFAEALNLKLFLFLSFALLNCSCLLLGNTVSIVTDDFQIFFALTTNCLLLAIESNLV